MLEEAHDVGCAAKRGFCRMHRGLSVNRGGVRNASKHRGEAVRPRACAVQGNAANALAQTTEQQILAEQRDEVRATASPTVQRVLRRRAKCCFGGDRWGGGF